MSYDSWLEGPYQRMVERGEEEMLAREEVEMAMAEMEEIVLDWFAFDAARRWMSGEICPKAEGEQ